MINGNYKLRRYSGFIPKIIVIGSSTGGPDALVRLLSDIASINKFVPILITQHIANGFGATMAKHLSKVCQLDCIVAKNGMKITSGKTYIAPENRHMKVREYNLQQQEDECLKKNIFIKISDGEKINYHRPSVDPLFSSAVKIFGLHTLAIVLTGIGTDGLIGSLEVAQAGGSIIVQDKKTSVVWGMPGSVAKAGIANEILPIEKIGRGICSLLRM